MKAATIEKKKKKLQINVHCTCKLQNSKQNNCNYVVEELNLGPTRTNPDSDQ